MASPKFQQFMTGYCKRVGVEAPAADTDGSYVLRFDGRYQVRFGADHRNQLLLRHDFAQLGDETARREALEKLLRVNLLLSGRKRSTLSLDQASRTPFLYDVVTLDEAEGAEGFKSVTAFVNEVAAFRRARDGRH